MPVIGVVISALLLGERLGPLEWGGTALVVTGVAAFVIAAIFTPPDVISQLMLAIPLCLLYELGMLMAKFVSKPVKPESESTDLV